MSKALRVVAQVAAVVAIVASIAIPFVGPALAATLATVAAAASAVSAASALGAQMLQKPPDMKGTINQVVIGANMPVPYVMGRTYVGGMKVYDNVATNGKPNSDRTQIFVGTRAGPIEGFEKFLADYSPITFAVESGGLIHGVAGGFYGADDGYLWLNTRKGLRPDTALTAYPGRVGFTGWGTNHKLSGMAAWSATMEFDEDGVRWGGGIPAFGMVAKWVMTYDPRKDSTYPGGAGTQRLDDEATWVYGTSGTGYVAQGENPALHAIAYARGRFENGKKVVGAGIPKDAIDIAAFVELANVCDANGWTVGGAIYEGPGISRWDNLKRILAAAAAEPAWVGGQLTCRISAPKVSLYTITNADLAEGEIEIQAMANWKDRFNTIVPRVRLETHKWDYQQLDAVQNSTYLAEDGETKTDEVQFDLCQNTNQGARLAAYSLANRREFGPIKLNAKPHLMGFRPGEAVELNIPEAGLENQLAVITARAVDPASGAVQFTLVSETTAKHAWALGQTGVAPPTPTIFTPQETDTAVAGANPALADVTQVPAITFTADYQGNIDPSNQLPFSIALKRHQAGTDVTSATAWSVSVDSGDITASIGASTGVLSITAVGSSGQITVTSNYHGVSRSQVIPIIQGLAPAPATGSSGGGSTNTDTSFNSISSATMTTISDVLTVTAGSGGQVVLSAPLTVRTAAASPPDVPFPVYGIWQWDSTGSGGWTDLGTEVLNSVSAVVNEDAETGTLRAKAGTLSVGYTKSGLTAGLSYKFRLNARNSSGTRTMSFSGTASAVGS